MNVATTTRIRNPERRTPRASCYFSEVIEQARIRLKDANSMNNANNIVEDLFLCLGLPGFYKTQKANDKKTITFSEPLGYSFANKVLQSIKHHGSLQEAYKNKHILFCNTPHIQFFLDSEKLNPNDASSLDDLLIEFCREFNNWIRVHSSNTNNIQTLFNKN